MKPTDISIKVRERVWDRDRCCCVCGSHRALTMAHVFHSRAHGGKGIEQNIALLCMECHNSYDNGRNVEHKHVKSILYPYMFMQYPDLDITKLKEE